MKYKAEIQINLKMNPLLGMQDPTPNQPVHYTWPSTVTIAQIACIRLNNSFRNINADNNDNHGHHILFIYIYIYGLRNN